MYSVVITLVADVLAPLGARASAATVMTNSESHIQVWHQQWKG